MKAVVSNFKGFSGFYKNSKNRGTPVSVLQIISQAFKYASGARLHLKLWRDHQNLSENGTRLNVP
jgi:hypothetical protein